MVFVGTSFRSVAVMRCHAKFSNLREKFSSCWEKPLGRVWLSAPFLTKTTCTTIVDYSNQVSRLRDFTFACFNCRALDLAALLEAIYDFPTGYTSNPAITQAIVP